MLINLRKRMQHEEEGGFTLIELMVVVLIIAILIAIAIPTFLGARKRAQDRAGQSNIRNAFTAEKTYYTDNQVYTATAADLTAIEPSLTYSALSPGVATGNALFVQVATGVVTVASKSASGTCFYLQDDPNGTTGTQYGKSATCVAVASVTGWASAW